jgi:hypothetical protein
MLVFREAAVLVVFWLATYCFRLEMLMLLSNWLRPFLARTKSRRERVKMLQIPAIARSQQSVERLETRLYLSGLTSYSSASSNWFGVVDASFSLKSGLSGSSSSSGSSSDDVSVRRFLVRLTPEATAQAGSLSGVQNLISDNDVELVVTDGLGLPGQVIISTTERDSVQVVQSLSDNDAVAYFEEDFSVGATTTRFPNEEGSSAEFSRQFGLNNTGQTGGVADADIDAPEAWDISIGSTQIVASVIDSGVDFTHPDLYLNIWLNQGELPPQFIDPDETSTLSDFDSDGLITFRDLNDAANSSFVTDLNGNGYIDASDLLEDPKWADGIDTDGNGFEDDLVGWDFFENDNKPFDEHRHGTHVAGILGAVGDNGFGVSGVNWQTSIMPLRFLDEDNRGDVSSAVEAINYTTMMRIRADNPVNVRVSNNSWGASGAFSQTLFDAVAGNERADILFVAAAGNGDVLGQGVNNDDVAFFPANLDLNNVISVAAINDRGELASFSNFGTTTVDIAAPGVSIVSTDVGGGFISRSGTSMATPFVAGVGALVFDVFPEATAAEVRDAILSGAVTSASLDGFIEGGRSLNALGALTASTFAPVPELEPVSTIIADGTTSLDITVTYTDDGSVDTTSFDIRDIEITRQGFSETLVTPASVTTTTINVDGQDRDAAVYTFTAPGGTFDATDNGTWFVSLREGEIQDNLGLYSAPRELGQFTVNIDAANVFFVNTTLDTVDADLGDGVPEDSTGRTSLRAAIMHANQTTAATTIVIPDGVYALTIPGQNENAATTGDLDLTSTHGITIFGGGAFVTTIDAQQLDRVFDIASGTTATITGLTIRNGGSNQGGGIQNRGTLTLQQTLITSNTAETAGGGIFSSGTLTVSDSSVESNSTFSRFFGLGGGGIAIIGTPDTPLGQTQITHSSIVSNTSSEAGGGILSFDADLLLTGVTIHGNTAQRSDGGGLYVHNSDTGKVGSLTSTTVTQNRALNGTGGGLSFDALPELSQLSSSIIAENQARDASDVDGRITSDGTSLFGQPNDADPQWRRLRQGVADFDQIGTTQSPLDPQLTDLQSSGGIVHARTPVPGGRASRSDIIGTAIPLLTPGLPIVYSTAEQEPNNSRAQAMRLDDRGWSLDANPDITDSTTIPHVTITGTGDDTFDYYSFTVTQPGATAILDIDNAALPNDNVFDTELFLFDSSGQLLASNDDETLDPGSTSELNSRITYTFAAAGYYTLAVGAHGSSYNSDSLSGDAPPAGKQYVLNVSVENHRLSEVLYSPAPNNVLSPVSATNLGNGYLFAARIGTSLFDGVRSYAVGGDVGEGATGDINGDGIVDLAISDPFNNTIALLIGVGDGTFRRGKTLLTGNTPVNVIIADFNNDDFVDLFTANQNTGDVTVLPGTGTGDFLAPISSISGVLPYSAATGDLNSDGFLDAVVGHDGTLAILIGDGTGRFLPPENVLSGGTYDSIVLDDLNQDGTLDIALAVSAFNEASGEFQTSVNILLGDGDGTFTERKLDGLSASTVKLADVNHDSRPDLLFSSFASSVLQVAIGNGDGTFNAPEMVGDVFSSFAIGNVDGDEFPDIITSDDNSTIILPGNGDGTFGSAVSTLTGFRLSPVLSEDFDGDGRTDIVTTSFFGGAVNVLLASQIAKSTAPYSIATGSRTADIAHGDINLDGLADVIVAHSLTGQVELLLANGNGTFRSAGTANVGDKPVAVVAGYFNADEFIDLATANQDSNNVTVLLGQSGGQFATPLNYSVASSPRSLILDDFNRDGIPDLVTANSSGVSQTSVLIGTASGVFQPAVHYDTADPANSVATGDFDGDGLTDVVTTSAASTHVNTVRYGTSSGTLGPEVPIPPEGRVISAAAADINADGFDDLMTISVISDQSGNEEWFVITYLGQRNRSLTKSETFKAGNKPNRIYVTDVTGDGLPDIVTPDTDINNFVGAVNILAGNGNATFQQPIRYVLPGGPTGFTFTDSNGDGNNDIVAALTDGRVTVVPSAQVELLLLQDGQLVNFPSRGTPQLPVSSAQTGYFVTREPETGQAVVWSVDTADPSVGQVGQFSVQSESDAPTEVIVSGSEVLVTSDERLRIFGLSAGTERSFSFASGTVVDYRQTDTGPGPVAVHLVDTNADGLDDVIVANRAGQSLSILLGTESGRLVLSQEITVSGGDLVSVAAGLLDNDEFVDLAIVDHACDCVRIALGNGDGTFDLITSFDVGAGPISVALGHINSDEFLDVVTVNADDQSVSVVLNNGDDTVTRKDFPLGLVPADIAIADMDGDQRDDVVVVGQFSSAIVLLSSPNGSLSVGSPVFTGDAPQSVDIADVDGDGINDVVTLDMEDPDVSILYGNGDGSLGEAIHYDIGRLASSVITGDINDDGVIDVLTSTDGTNDVRVLSGTGNRTFAAVQVFAVGDDPVKVAVGDVNGDGIIDVLTANQTGGGVSALIGQSRLRSVLTTSTTTFAVGYGGLYQKPSTLDAFVKLAVQDVKSRGGETLGSHQYQVLDLEEFDSGILALIELRNGTLRPGDLDLVLIDPATGETESLLSDSVVRLAADESSRVTIVGDTVYLTAADVIAGTGVELYSFDRNTGLRLVVDIIPGSASSEISDFLVHGNELYFTALRVREATGAGTPERELFVLDTLTDELKVVRSGRVVTEKPVLAGNTVLLVGRLREGLPELLWTFDESMGVVPGVGAAVAVNGGVSGVVFIDRNGNGQQDSDESGRSGVMLYVDLNANGRREDSEPAVVSRSDDPATSDDERGRFVFSGLPAGNYRIREVEADGFIQTSPLTIQTGLPAITSISSAVTGAEPAFGLPSIVGDGIVSVNRSTGELVRREADGTSEVVLNLQSMLPDDATAIESIGTSHAQDGDSVVFTVTLTDGRELVLTADSRSRLDVLAVTGAALTTVAPGSPPGSTTLLDVEDARNEGFDSLSISNGVVGFLAAPSTGAERYYLGNGQQFAEFAHAQVLLDGDNEVFVDRVVEGTGTVLTGADLFLDKATLDARESANSGWQITTRLGDEILPLTFFDRVFDVSVSGLSAAFHASSVDGSRALYLTREAGRTTRLADSATAIPDGVGTFTGFGSLAGSTSAPSVAFDGRSVVFVGQGQDGQIGLYALVDGTLRTIVDTHTNFGGRTLADLAIGHQAVSGNRIVFHATFADGTESIELAELPAEPVLNVTVTAGQTVSGVAFGASAQAGTIRGTSFTDLDVDGVFDAGEEGNVGRTVFLDVNLNGQLDDSEISTTTDENGEFVFNDLASETEYVVREVLPEGLAVTVPQMLADATVRLGAAGTVEVVLGSVDSGALGNSANGVVSGVIFNDTNGDGERGDASAEPGIPDLTVFVDENGDGILNGGERSSTTTADGSYIIDQLRGTKQAVRVVLPGETTDQTSPLGNAFSTTNLRTVDSPVEVVTGDFNGDGIDDIATTINQASEVRLFFNEGDGSFIAGDSVEVAGGPGSIAVGSFQGPSGKNGLVVGHRTTSSVKVLIPQPDNSFDSVDLITPQDILSGGQYEGLGFGPFMVTTGDFNADGNDDIAVASQSALPAGGAVAVFLSDGDGTFTHEQTLTLPRADADFPTAIAAGLVNPGGTVDLVLSNLGTANVTILSNSGVAGSGRFSIDQYLPALGRAPSSVQIGDLDGDGDNEIVTTNLLSNNVSIFDNNGDGTFATATVLTAGQGPAFSKLIDLDQNGSLDIAFSNSEAGNRFGILRNRGDGTFLAAETSGLALLSDGTLAFSLAVGSFDDDNGDGVIDDLDTPDVVVSNRAGESLNAGAGGLTVGLNSIVPGALTVELPSDTRSASGLNFGLRTVNLPPTITTPDDPDPIDEDAGQQTVVLTGITTGGETETLQVTVASNNTSLIVPVATFNAGTGTATVRYTPIADQSGTAQIAVTVRDAGIDGSFDAAGPDSDDGVVTASFSVVVNALNDLPRAEADTFGVLLENGPATLDVLANDNLANPDTGETLTILFAGQPASGSVSIINGGKQLRYTPADGFIGQETFNYIVSDNQFTAQGSVTVNVTSSATPTDLLLVSSLTPNPSGFDVVFSEAFNASLLNLYSTQSLGPADVVVTGDSTGNVQGSLIVDGDAGTASFIRTGGPLRADTYTVILRSGASGFVTTDGDLLDGDSNGTGGDNFTTTFTIAPLSPETITVSIPDFARGYGQKVDVPADGTGIPLTLSRGTGISSLNLEVSYDSSLLDITGFVPTVAGLLTDFNTETGALAVSKPTEFTSDAGPLTIGHFTANVPADALYTSKHLIEIGRLQVFDDSVETALVPSVADSAIHVAAFPGDANASRSYNSPDATLTLRQATDRIDGLTLYPLADPALISDVTFDSSILANDATVVQRLITNVDVPAVPDLPNGVDPLPARGPDPILSIPQNLTGRLGQTVSVPVQVEVTEAAGITISGLDVAISYDASLFSVSNVRAGTLLTDNDQSPFSVFANTSTPGQLLVTASSSLGTSTLAQGTSGDVFLIDFTVLPTAAAGASTINLLANSSGLVTGIADNDLSDLVLSPAPTNGANDSVDGLFTITTDVTLVEKTEAGQLVVRDASPAGLNNQLAFSIDAGTLVITESVLPIVAVFGQQISDLEVRVALADLSTLTVDVQLLDGNDSADASAVTNSVSLKLAGGSGNDILTGGALNDTLSGGLGDDDLDGGSGTDFLTISQDGHLTITTTQTFGQGTDTFANIEQALLEGGSRNNRLDASLATIPVTLLGQSGNDTLLGGSAADVLDGGDGIDFAEVFGSNIVLTDTSAPGAGAETLIALEGLQLVASARGSNIDASGYTLGPVLIIGSSGNDILKGGSGNDTILAGAGRDSINGGSGADFIAGRQGNDVITGDAGNDTIFGGGGNDDIDGGADNDFLSGGGGRDTIRGGAGTDFATGDTGQDQIDGNDGDDTLFGGSGADNIAGGLGTDRLNGVDRDDTFDQVVGRDTLIGGNRPSGRPAPVNVETSPTAKRNQPQFQTPPGFTEEIDEAFLEPLIPELLEL